MKSATWNRVRLNPLAIEQLEPRKLLAGNITATLQSGDLQLLGDTLDNSVMVFQTASGMIRVVGQNDTTVNGQRTAEFPALGDDMIASLIQGGTDELILYGRLSIPDKLSVTMEAGSLLVDGTRGKVSIGGDVIVSGGDACNVALTNEVRVQGKTDIDAGGTVSSAAGLAKRVTFDPTQFSDSLTIDNPYFPLVPGTTYTYKAVEIDSETGETVHETVLVNVLHQTRTISGIQARVVHDRVWRNAVLVEDTFDWYAQDNQGNVWYLGEIATNFKYDDQGNLIGTNHDGSWETGVSGATPGIQMAATPHVGDRYYQEFRPRVAVDQGDVLATNESVVGPLGTFDGVLKTRDWTVLTPSSLERKYFAPGLGGILTEHINPHTGEIESSVRLVKATLNGVPVTQVVDPTTFTGASNIGSGNGFAHVAGTTKIRNSQSVFVEGARFGGDIDIRSAGEVGIRNSRFNTQLSVRAADAASLQSVVANGDVFLYGNMNVTVNKSNLRDEFEIDLGRDNNAVVVTESKLVELQIDGHEGANTLDLDDATIVAELDLFRIERI